MGGPRPVPGIAGAAASSMSRRAMGQPRRITDSFPRRRRRRGPGRPPGRLKDKEKEKAQGKAKVRDRPPAAPQPPPDPALLEMLRRFDLCWEYGPCTALLVVSPGAEASCASCWERERPWEAAP
ncbi:DNA polymerase delta subunit 4 isoform X2 [Corapipo altera]|uniref:DNA polymerase delta subunit 4 isoform X2 n=1 Tax=Corapipo altera TaxID=415028 RepID=UPI000FD62C8B|nr:DNA polymerase delta subunit 4 isoform X2 [Corapipo altera]